jgi:hypothetical protein
MPPMLSQHASSLLMLAGVAVAVYLLMRGSGRGLLKSPAAEAEPGAVKKLFAPRDRNKALADAPDELLRWQVEMHETARDLKAEIDTKFAALQALAIIARQEAERLEAAVARAEKLEPGPSDTLAAIESLADPEALADSSRLARVAAELPPPPRGLRGELFDENRQAVAITNLSAQGLSPTEIARRLSLPLGDVELLLNLRPA